jgi:hypothetical protein
MMAPHNQWWPASSAGERSVSTVTLGSQASPCPLTSNRFFVRHSLHGSRSDRVQQRPYCSITEFSWESSDAKSLRRGHLSLSF